MLEQVFLRVLSVDLLSFGLCRVCLAEVYQDKALVGDFMNRKYDYEDPKVGPVWWLGPLGSSLIPWVSSADLTNMDFYAAYLGNWLVTSLALDFI